MVLIRNRILVDDLDLIECKILICNKLGSIAAMKVAQRNYG